MGAKSIIISLSLAEGTQHKLGNTDFIICLMRRGNAEYFCISSTPTFNPLKRLRFLVKTLASSSK